ncbi:MAG: penicillin-binding protein 2 [Patescibacteria group bacterium]
MRWRYFLITLGFFAAFAALAVNLYNLQFKKTDYFFAKVKSQYLASGTLEASRGNIYFVDKNDNLILAALNKDYDAIFAVPKEIQQIKQADIKIYSEKLSSIVNMPVEDLEKKLSKKNDQYELLVFKATKDQLQKIKDLNFRGIYIDKQKARFYSFGKLASHLLGFVSPANEFESLKYGNAQIGRYGIELHFNDYLAGEPGNFEGDKIVESKNGQDLILTIERNLQARAEEILKKLVNDWQAEAGTIVVQEPATGKILAMANFPDFDPNDYSKSDLKNFPNQAIQGVYEFGSVLKIMTMAAGLDSGKITPETTYIDKGSATFNGRTIKNWDDKIYGKINMADVLEYSVNTGSVFAERETGHKIFLDYLNKFGLNELTNINLPGEVRGNMKNLKNGKDIHFATASFGQGISITSIALINAFSAIANNGVLMKPLISADEKPEAIRRVISPKTAETLTKMMVSVVEKNKITKIFNYSIAGKSGTAYIPDFKNGGYTDEVINAYVGFLPVKNQQKFTILIKLDKPAGIPFANSTVAPAFKELAEFIINYYNLSPDNI